MSDENRLQLREALWRLSMTSAQRDIDRQIMKLRDDMARLARLYERNYMAETREMRREIEKLSFFLPPKPLVMLVQDEGAEL